MVRHLRPLLFTTAAIATLVTGLGPVGAAAPALPPGITLPPRSSDTTTTTAAPTTTVPPTTVPPTTVAPPATTPPGETKIIPVSPPQGATKIVTDPTAGSGTGSGTTGGGSGTTTTTKPSATAADAPRLSDGQVDQILRTMERSGASSTVALVDALKPLQAVGMTAQDALVLGMGRFPVQGVANWTDDWLDYRAGPPVHQHMGNDLFTAFNTPVRAPADGTVRFAREGLGGLAAYVTTSDGTYYYMAHLSGFAPDLASGASVTQGRTVGFAGDTGDAAGGPPHVHFEIHPGGGAAVNPKPIVDGWVADALAHVPDLLASFQPAGAAGAPGAGDGGGVPQILVDTGLTRRFSTPSRPATTAAGEDFGRAVLGPLTPPALSPLLDMGPVLPKPGLAN
ncbi:MAG: M23 family metallopeptidase [Actinomycetota bacterium]|nr:M23 family metallopeptidase [Actinomycetota bacterium]